MDYVFEIVSKCEEEIRKHCKKNPVLEKAIRNKMKEILGNPQ